MVLLGGWPVTGVCTPVGKQEPGVRALFSDWVKVAGRELDLAVATSSVPPTIGDSNIGLEPALPRLKAGLSGTAGEKLEPFLFAPLLSLFPVTTGKHTGDLRAAGAVGPGLDRTDPIGMALLVSA